MLNTLYRCTRTIARHQNAPLAESRCRYLEHLAAQGAAIHTIRAAAGVIYRTTVLMKLDDPAQWSERMSSERRNDGLIGGIEMPAAAGPIKPTRSSDRRRATGCALPVDYANPLPTTKRIWVLVCSPFARQGREIRGWRYIAMGADWLVVKAAKSCYRQSIP